MPLRRSEYVHHGWPAGQLREFSRTGLEQCLDTMAALVSRPPGAATEDRSDPEPAMSSVALRRHG